MSLKMNWKGKDEGVHILLLSFPIYTGNGNNVNDDSNAVHLALWIDFVAGKQEESMKLFTCPVCGGKLNIRIGAEYAICDSCGNVTKIDPAEAERFARIYQSAERSMRLNSVEGYEEALRQLDSISFIEEARKKATECENQLHDLQADLQRRQVSGPASESQNTSFAGVLLAITLVFCAAAFTGIVYLVLRLIRGTLSPTATAIVVGLAALAILFIFVNKAKQSK